MRYWFGENFKKYEKRIHGMLTDLLLMPFGLLTVFRHRKACAQLVRQQLQQHLDALRRPQEDL